jgi:hypothetical protein
MIIVVEVKCFDSTRTQLDEFYQAVGQYVSYRNALTINDMHLPVYLSVPLSVYVTFFQIPLIAAVILSCALGKNRHIKYGIEIGLYSSDKVCEGTVSPDLGLIARPSGKKKQPLGDLAGDRRIKVSCNHGQCDVDARGYTGHAGNHMACVHSPTGGTKAKVPGLKPGGRCRIASSKIRSALLADPRKASSGGIIP